MPRVCRVSVPGIGLQKEIKTYDSSDAMTAYSYGCYVLLTGYGEKETCYELSLHTINKKFLNTKILYIIIDNKTIVLLNN